MQSADDCRRKFVARRLFYKLAKDKKIFLPCYENGPFKLWRDDYRPANVLLNDDMQIAGAVDWEFTYAVRAEFSYAPPWGCFSRRPSFDPRVPSDWAQVFDRRLKTFVSTVRRCEQTTKHDQSRLSDRMQRSWESGDFWVVYAILHSFAFDAICWQKIDRRDFRAHGD